MQDQLIPQIIEYLNDPNHYQWSTSKTMIARLSLQEITPLELDERLLQYFQNTENSQIRFSALPSKINLEVLWGSVDRINPKEVIDIYKQDEEIQIEELERSIEKDLFLSHSFKDSASVVALSKKLIEYNIYTWLAEIEIVKYEHINQAVINAIEQLPFFGVFISEAILNSIWSAKEIGFALSNKKEIVGFINTADESLFSKIEEPDTMGGSRISRNIYRQFFDNASNVKFILYPDSNHPFCQQLKAEGRVVDWDYLNNLL